MQKITAILPSWDKTKTGSKKGFDKAWGWADKLGAPVNRLSNRIGSEAFWPTTLDKESDKAARILRSFCKDGFYAEEEIASLDGPKKKQKVLKKIPQKVIENAVGLAIFTTMRTGLWISGAGGSGILIARKEDGTWSPPSGILLHTAGLGFLVGVDIYDCVVVINNRKALESFTKIRATLGGEISAVAGPVGMGGVLENDGKWKQANKPVFTYLKSRGFYAGVQVDGTVIIERSDENERFYGQKIGVADILAGKVRHPPYEIKMLMETVKAAEGRGDVDQAMMEELDDQPAPGDVNVDMPTQPGGPVFGVPEADDPDPFGVLALEKEGLEIREAGSRSRPESSQFEFRPNPTSPVYPFFHRRSMDTLATSNRGSYMSNKTRASIDRSTQTSEMATQTDVYESTTPITSPRLGNENPKIIEEQQEVDYTKIDLGPYTNTNHKVIEEPQEIDYTKIDLGPYNNTNQNGIYEFDSNGSTITEHDEHSKHHHHTDNISLRDSETETIYTTDEEGDEEGDDEEEPIIFEAASAQATRGSFIPQVSVVQAKGSLVTIPKRIPPALPPRSPMRSTRSSVAMIDAASGESPLYKDGFEDVEINGTDHSSKSDKEQSPVSDITVMVDHTVEMAAESPSKVEASVPIRLTDPSIKVEEHEVLKPMHGNLSVSNDEEDEAFHSLPTTPLETLVR